MTSPLLAFGALVAVPLAVPAGTAVLNELTDQLTEAVVAVNTDDSPVAIRLRNHPGLSDADVAVLACADARDGVAVMDESAGRSAAEVEDIETRGSAYVVLSAVQQGMLPPERGRETIDAGWYVAPDVYTTLVRKLESFE